MPSEQDKRQCVFPRADGLADLHQGGIPLVHLQTQTIQLRQLNR